MKGMIVTPHKNSSYDSCIFSERDGKHWENTALEYACDVMEQLWDDLDIHGEINVKMEYRELTDEEAAAEQEEC
jgi:hypothetical protein